MRLITDPEQNRKAHSEAFGVQVPVPPEMLTLGSLAASAPALRAPSSAPSPMPHAEISSVEIERAKVATRLSAVRAKASGDVAAKLEGARLALARELREAELEEHELATDAVYRSACLDRGEEMVARIMTRDGSIVLRAESEPESDERQAAIAMHARAAERASGEAERKRHLENMEEEARMWLRKLVLSDLAHFNRVTAKYHALWASIERARADLVSGRVLAEGKGGAR